MELATLIGRRGGDVGRIYSGRLPSVTSRHLPDMACHGGGPRGGLPHPRIPSQTWRAMEGVRGGGLPHPRMLSRKLPSRLAYVPTVVENEGGNRERTFDIYSRLLRDRIILIGRPIDDAVANPVVSQPIYLPP